MQSEKGISFLITEEAVKKAKSIVKKGRISYDDDACRYLCALNLLNAAIKKPDFKKALSYALIKCNAGVLVGKIDQLDGSAASYYYNMEERCLYYEIYGVIFSFHDVRYSPELQKASSASPIEWSGIRLQRIAQPLMEEYL
ncbi:MAG: hypothetical protein HDS39_00210 [Bacteroides sp.]|nr:hypothetical protein [Bacteroides sp.]